MARAGQRWSMSPSLMMRCSSSANVTCSAWRECTLLRFVAGEVIGRRGGDRVSGVDLIITTALTAVLVLRVCAVLRPCRTCRPMPFSFLQDGIYASKALQQGIEHEKVSDG